MKTDEAARRAQLQDFYGSSTWKHTRDVYRRRVGGLCEDCKERGYIKAGVVVHHIIPLTPANIGEYGIALSDNNLRLLCEDCHARIHADRKDETSAGRRKSVRPVGSKRKRRYTVDENTGKVTPSSPPSRKI